jgi:hypothetical protein
VLMLWVLLCCYDSGCILTNSFMNQRQRSALMLRSGARAVLAATSKKNYGFEQSAERTVWDARTSLVAPRVQTCSN